MLDPTAIQAASSPERSPSVFTLLALIWLRPRRALAAVADGPGWLWLAPMILALALVVGRTLAAAPGITAERLARNQAIVTERIQEVPEEYRDTLPEEMTQVPEPGRVLVLWVPLALGIAGILFGWLVRAAVLHVGSLAMGGRQSYGRIYRTAAWATVPLLLRDLVQIIYLVTTGTVIQGAGLSGLLASTDVPSSSLTVPRILLGRIDLYTVWYVLLLGIAVLVAGKLSRGKVAGVVAVYVVLSLLTSLGQLLAQGFTGGL